MGFFLLLAIGIILIALEVFVTSFVVIWFGLGFLLVSIIEVFYPLENIFIQLGLVSIFSLLLLFLFRKRVKNRFFKAQKEIKDDFFNESGYGEVKSGKIFFKGTFWDFEANVDVDLYKEKDKVFVEKTKNNIAYIKKV